MSQFSTLKSFFLAGAALTLVAACGDADITSPGEGDFIGAPPGGGGGGGGGVTTRDLTFGGCPGGTSAQEIPGSSTTACRVLLDGNGNILQDLVLTASRSQPRAYFFDQAAFVGIDDGPTAAGGGGVNVELTIQPGAQLAFLNQTDFLTVNRGSRITAQGTAGAPIVLTSDDDLIDDGVANESQGDARGQWGGLIINGRANINNCGDPSIPATCDTSGEGGTGDYGGGENGDNSGTLEYVRVQYAGFEITPNNELNGIAFQGVGDGTTVNYIQVHNNDDDGVEFFGGKVNVRYVVVTGADDDAVDWVAGWDGVAQNVLVIGSGNGDNGFEGDNNEDNNDVAPRSNPQFSNFTLIGGPGEDLGMQIREGTAGLFLNGVVDSWDDGCLDVDDDATFALIDSTTPADGGDEDLQIDFTTFACGTPFISGDGDESASNTLDNSNFPGVQLITSSLEGPLPGPNEASATSVDPMTINMEFAPENYVGAFDPALDAEDTWAFGWTVRNSVFNTSCPDHPNVQEITGNTDVVPPAGGEVCVIFGNITEDLTLTAFNTYSLNGAVRVGIDQGPDAGAPSSPADTATLTIESGVTVYGATPTDFLVVNRGSQISAVGNATDPIVFTSERDVLGLNTGGERGQWGGLIINGRANINNCTTPGVFATCDTSGEGNTGDYGGNDNNDDSGALNYVRVQFAGFEITSDNELNGIAFQAVGDATDVDFIQVHNNDDDGVEFFGGAVDVSHVVLTGVDDDALDWVAGWNGSAQFVLIAGSGDGDNGFEGDNNEDANLAGPVSNPVIANWTAIGGAGEDLGMQIREGTAGTFINGVVSGWDDGCLDIDDDATYDGGAITPVLIGGTSDGINPGPINDTTIVDLQIDATYFSCGTAFISGDGDESASNTLDGSTFPGIVTGSSSLTVPTGFNTAIINGDNENAVTPIDPTSLVGVTLDPVNRIGANGQDDDWFEGWTVPGSF